MTKEQLELANYNRTYARGADDFRRSVNRLNDVKDIGELLVKVIGGGLDPYRDARIDPRFVQELESFMKDATFDLKGRLIKMANENNELLDSELKQI
jgi:hypothetical protein